MATTGEIVAVSFDEFWLYGCPACGHCYAAQFSIHSESGAILWQCRECAEGFYTLPKGLTSFPFALNGLCPKLQTHPRRGIPKNGLPTELPPQQIN